MLDTGENPDAPAPREMIDLEVSLHSYCMHSCCLINKTTMCLSVVRDCRRFSRCFVNNLLDIITEIPPATGQLEQF